MENEYPPAALIDKLDRSLVRDQDRAFVGLTITVRAKSGISWDATITEVVERSAARLLVRTPRLDQ